MSDDGNDEEDVETEESLRKDVEGWLSREVRNCAKELELRTREVTGFAEGFLRGELTHEQYIDRVIEYEGRWPPALGGCGAAHYKTDEALLAAIDANRDKDVAQRVADGKRLMFFEKKYGQYSGPLDRPERDPAADRATKRSR